MDVIRALFLLLMMFSPTLQAASFPDCVDQSGFWGGMLSVENHMYYWDIAMKKESGVWQSETHYYDENLVLQLRVDHFTMNGEVLTFPDIEIEGAEHRQRRYFILCLPDGTQEYNYQAEVFKGSMLQHHLMVRTTVLLVSGETAFAQDALKIRDTFWENNQIVEDDQKVFHRMPRPLLKLGL